MKILAFFKQKRFKHGALATAVTIIFVAVIVLINIIATTLINRFPLKVDLTGKNMFNITQETIDYLAEINQPVNITVLFDEASLSTGGIAGKQITEIVNKYSQYSDNISVSYIDPDKNPEILARFKTNYKGDLSSKMIVIEAGDRVRALSESDLLTYTETSVSSTSERALTSAVLYVTDLNPTKVTVLTGEGDITGFKDLLTSNGYDVDEIDPLTGVINEETDILIINSPLNDYTTDTVNKLSSFLDNGGTLNKHILYLASYGQKSTPNIDAFLAEWGIKIDSGYIMDTNSANITMLGSNAYGVVATLEENDYAKGVSQKALPVVAPYSRPITQLFEASDSRKTGVLLKTSTTGVIIPDGGVDSFDGLEKSFKNVIVSGVKNNYVGSTLHSSSVVAFGSNLIVDGGLLSSASLNNGDYTISIMNTLSGKEKGIFVMPTNLTSTALEMTQSQANWISRIVLIGIPLVIIIIGIVVFIRRRNQ